MEVEIGDMADKSKVSSRNRQHRDFLNGVVAFSLSPKFYRHQSPANQITRRCSLALINDARLRGEAQLDNARRQPIADIEFSAPGMVANHGSLALAWN